MNLRRANIPSYRYVVAKSVRRFAMGYGGSDSGDCVFMLPAGA